jgi:hypothetical protein
MLPMNSQKLFCNKRFANVEHAGDQWLEESTGKGTPNDVSQSLQGSYGVVICPKPELPEKKAPFFEFQEFEGQEFKIYDFEAQESVAPEFGSR